jgi:glycosyltransferase involved in cell wall biosynthesis
MFELMGVGSPIICSVEGEAAALIERAASGLCIEPESVGALVAAVRRLYGDAALREQLAASGRQFVRVHYLRSALAERYLDALAGILGKSAAQTAPRAAAAGR